MDFTRRQEALGRGGSCDSLYLDIDTKKYPEPASIHVYWEGFKKSVAASDNLIMAILFELGVI